MSAAGARVGPFELLARLGSGGQGEIYLARPWDDTLRRGAARHWLRARLAVGAIDAPLAARWRLAALKLAHPGAAASLHDEHGHLAAPGAAHPHLVALYSRRHPGCTTDLGLLAGRVRRPYLALAYLPGVSLERLLAHRQPMPERWAITVALQLAAAMVHLHSRGVVHHDLRPANVIVCSRGPDAPHATLIDLGAAETPARPRRRAVYGTLGHLPPERTAVRPAPASPLVDVYSLGVLLRRVVQSRASPALAALIADATTPEPDHRAARVPDMAALSARLAAL